MTLSLPEDAEPFIPDGKDLSHLSHPGVYSLHLSRPDHLADRWDHIYDARPPYFQDLQTADQVVYVGKATNVLARLEDHAEGDVRQAALLRVCEIDSIFDVWWFQDADDAAIRESGIALELQREHPSWFVHQR